MIMHVDKNETIQALEVIIETQQSELNTYGNSVALEAQEYLNILLQFPLGCNKIMLTEEEALFISKYFQ